jgi:exonuclease III
MNQHPPQKLLCLNVRSGGGARWAAILDFVGAHNPDIAIFTEWRRGVEPGPVERWASSRSMKCIGACEGATLNGVAIAAKRPFDRVSATPGRESAGTMLRANFDGWTVLAAYFPQGQLKQRYFDVCRDVATAHSEQPFLLVGDLNTGNQVADKSPTGAKYECDERFDRLSSIEGLADLWRLTNGDHAREWTWCTAKNGFRIDHAFGNSEFIRRYRPECRYDHTPRREGFSDHSAILLGFEEGLQ